MEPAHNQHKSTGVFLLPEPVHNMDLDQMPRIRVERVHEKLNVVEVVEFPAFRYQRIPQEVAQRDCVLVQTLWQVADPCELPRGALYGRLTPPLSRRTDGPRQRLREVVGRRMLCLAVSTTGTLALGWLLRHLNGPLDQSWSAEPGTRGELERWLYPVIPWEQW